MKTTWQRAAEDMGMKKDSFYRTRDALVEKDLISIKRVHNGVSIYEVNLDSLTANYSHTENDSHTENGVDSTNDSPTENGLATDSLTENGHSHTENEDSHQTETKKNTKKNMKKNIQEKKNSKSASAPVDSSLNVDTPESSLIEETPVLPLKDDAPAVVLKEDSDAHSHTENESKFKPEPLADFFADTPTLDEETKRAVSELYFDPHWFPLLKGHKRAGRAYNDVLGVVVA